MAAKLDDPWYMEEDYEKESHNPIKLSFSCLEEVYELLDIPKEMIACVDIETTGLDTDKDEILQVSICNGNGTILLNSYIRPVKRKRWPKAAEINHITWSMVKDAPSLLDFEDAITEILNDCSLIIGYNVEYFDLEFLEAGGINVPYRDEVYDLINDCSVLFGNWSDYYENYTFVSLEKAARHYRIKFQSHDSSEDVKATVALFYKLLNDKEMRSQLRLRGEQQTKQATQPEIVNENKTTDEEQKNNTYGCMYGCLLILAILVISMLTMCGSMCSR